MSVWNYDDTPAPAGGPVTLNGEPGYQLALYDGADVGEQYLDDPDESVLFTSPEAARAWLAAVTEVLSPYIESGDRSQRVPDSTGWIVE